MTSAGSATRKWTLAELAEHVGGSVKGNHKKSINRIAKLSDATPDAIAHCSSSTEFQHLQQTQAGIVILRANHQDHYEGDCIITEQPRLAFSKIIDLLHPPCTTKPGIHPSVVVGEQCHIAPSVSIGPNATIGERVTIQESVEIGAGTVIEDDVIIGQGTRIGLNATIYRGTEIGTDCRFSAAVVLGAPGFSFEWDDARWIPVRNIGSLIIGDDVDVGACTSIDRGSIGATRLHDGVRIDNNCHIGHNVEIGEHTLIVANVGIGGSATIGKRCIIGGQVAIKDNVSVADDVTILGTSLVSKSIATAGTYSSAVPAREVSQWNRTLASLNRLNHKK